jgi:hypothetical protein
LRAFIAQVEALRRLWRCAVRARFRLLLRRLQLFVFDHDKSVLPYLVAPSLMGSKIIQKWVARLRPGMSTAAILEIMETDLRRGYELMGVDFGALSGHLKRRSMCLDGLADGDPTSAAFKNEGLLIVFPSDPPRNSHPATAARTDVLQAGFDFQRMHRGAMVNMQVGKRY